ncbi:MAG TPA: NAD(P)/FAD-dependent oxidoreductase [candidate division Zixibacteria bacterium]|nr:NAD(P)/FAD-dependent oxidoreductase [candidate division Zixibacteria bacterium]
MEKFPKVIIIGAGFGGLFAAKSLADKPVDVLLIDKNNYHTFTPLLYQVATCALDPSEIAHPIRTIFRKNRNVSFLLGEVAAIDPGNKQITVQTSKTAEQIDYDYLIVAAGSQSNYFGSSDLETFSYDLKTLPDAVDLRNHALRLFEKAVWTDNPEEVEALLTFVVVGAGPTGIETAGALYELYNHVLDKEFSSRNLQARVVLVEMQETVLNAYPQDLRQRAEKQLKSLGVELKLGTPVKRVQQNQVELGDGTIIPTHTLVWSAGIQGSPVANMLGIELVRGNRVEVNQQMQVIGHDQIYCIGDMSYLLDNDGAPYPQVSPVAQQQARVAAHNILAEIEGKRLQAFSYQDLGSMATIGRSRAVAWLFNRIKISGGMAWLAWLVFHLITLVGFRNRLNVFVNWVWNYITYDRSVRIILDRNLQKE